MQTRLSSTYRIGWPAGKKSSPFPSVPGYWRRISQGPGWKQWWPRLWPVRCHVQPVNIEYIVFFYAGRDIRHFNSEPVHPGSKGRSHGEQEIW